MKSDWIDTHISDMIIAIALLAVIVATLIFGRTAGVATLVAAIAVLAWPLVALLIAGSGTFVKTVGGAFLIFLAGGLVWEFWLKPSPPPPGTTQARR